MITTIILYGIYSFVSLITYPLRLLSDVSLGSNITNTLSTIGGYLNTINFFVPLSTLLTIFSTMLGIEGGILTYKIIMWIIKRIPTQS